MYFQYGDTEIEYLKAKDKRLAEVIDAVGHIDRPVDDDLFTSVIYTIIGQQISTKAQETICRRLDERYGIITPEGIAGMDPAELQSLGISFRKVDYIKDFAKKVSSGTFDLAAVEQMTDEEAVAALSSLRGVGAWTAEMLLLFCLQRPNILSYGDLAILRGMRMVYHHRKIDRRLFEKYRRRLSPYCSVASLYFWAVAGGAIPGMKDYVPKNTKKRTTGNR